ncbi:MAG: hypothetical protein ACI9YT_002206 [Halobacteriales archaeon]|jgi:hypothetical protein
MSTTGRTESVATAVGDVAAALSEARFVRVVASADGDALAAGGVLAAALDDHDVPFQVRTVAMPDDRAWRTDGPDECVVALGLENGDADAVVDPPETPTTVAAWQIAREIGGEPEPTLALAGAVAAGVTPGADGTAPLLEAADLERRPGIAVPTADLADGLAHSTLVHAAFSGDESAAGAALADLSLPSELDASARRRVASLVAVEATEGAPARAATAVERFLHPSATPAGPFETLGGYVDVLDALAATAPGIGVALALGNEVRGAALDEWRDHARRVHDGLRSAHTGRYDGVFVARHDDWSTATAARLLRDYRSPEPVALAVGDGEATLAGPGDRELGPVARAAAEAVDGRAGGAGRRARIAFDPETDVTDLVTAIREAL